MCLRKGYMGVAVAGVFLVGCSGEPSESDMKSALEDNIEQSMQAASELFGMLEVDKESIAITLHSVDKISCKESTRAAGGYDCSASVDMTAPFIGRSQDTASFTFIEHKGKWSVVE